MLSKYSKLLIFSKELKGDHTLLKVVTLYELEGGHTFGMALVRHYNPTHRPFVKGGYCCTAMRVAFVTTGRTSMTLWMVTGVWAGLTAFYEYYCKWRLDNTLR